MIAAAGLGGSAYAANAGAGERRRPPAQVAEECYVLTSEIIEGPYYIDADKIRRDVTEDRPGIPFVLTIKVIDNETCRPVRNAAVDIWHCDAVGVCSGYEDMGNGGGGGPAPTGAPTGTLFGCLKDTAGSTNGGLYTLSAASLRPRGGGRRPRDSGPNRQVRKGFPLVFL
ncbi:hypothetical protein QF037_004697 [Streptomyces canus]|uniref:dioxygenase family protein n=1 Tax=Streptomyces canus TaxID=58343 RepID=UPI00278769CC|nr:hypothetical protein [Streptomyces canus]